MRKRIALIFVISLVLVLVLAPSIGSAVNTIRCQHHDRMAVWSSRQNFILPLGNFDVVCADGSGPINQWIPHQLIEYGTVAVAFSPDGTRVAYASLGDPRSSAGVNIYVMNADGTEISRLLSVGNHSPHLAWSPDGKLLALDGNLPSGFGIYVVDPDCVKASADCVVMAKHLGDGIEPNWSPTGDKIAFEMNVGKGPEAFDYDIWVMDADGSNRVDLTPDEFQSLTPAWSPNGQLIALEYSRNPRGIYVMRPDGSDLTFLTDGSAPAWSTDGRNIIYISDRDSNGRKIGQFDSIIPVQSLYMIQRDSGAITRLTHNDSELILYYTWLPK